jgi:Asp-tRNA(Asn)/Glu-tRNA(Gln) amidotransferase A subunit family amidase
MTLAWSMDKIGPIARSIEDCALIFGAIHGRDRHDASSVDQSFRWPMRRDMKTIQVGYFKDETDDATLDVLRKEVGVKLVPIKLPSKYPIRDLVPILYAEASAAFDELTRQGTEQIPEQWRSSLPSGQFISAGDYIRANRVRSLLMEEMAEVMDKVDLYVGGKDLVLTNFTGHPTIVMPDGFVKRGKIEMPTAITFTGRLFAESELLAVGHAYQRATGHHLRRPVVKITKDE